MSEQTHIGLDDDQVACDLFIVQSLSQHHRAGQGERDVKGSVSSL